MNEMNTTFIATGVLFALQFSFFFNTAIRGPSKFTRGFCFVYFVVFFLFIFFYVIIVADLCIFIDVFSFRPAINPYT